MLTDTSTDQSIMADVKDCGQGNSEHWMSRAIVKGVQSIGWAVYFITLCLYLNNRSSNNIFVITIEDSSTEKGSQIWRHD